VTPLSAFVWPGLIILLMLGLLWPPMASAFGREQRQPEPMHSTAGEHGGTTGEHTGTPAEGGEHATPTGEHATPISEHAAPTATHLAPTAVPTLVPTKRPATATTAPTEAPTEAVPTEEPTEEPTVEPTEEPTAVPVATDTPVAALPPDYGDLEGGVPQMVSVGGKEFKVALSNSTLPDWKFSSDPTAANWVSGTFLNYVVGISYTEANAALFAALKPGDPVEVTRADGAVYTFLADQVRRVAPTDTSLLQQDHPAITLLLVGDTAPDRAVVQAHFVESATP
jgi:hypothetical protein